MPSTARLLHFLGTSGSEAARVCRALRGRGASREPARLSSYSNDKKPVMFPPGQAKVSTTPAVSAEAMSPLPMSSRSGRAKLEQNWSRPRLRFKTRGVKMKPRGRQFAVCGPVRVTREPSAESSACFASPHSPWSLPFAPPTPLRIAPLCSSASQLLWQGQTSRVRASSATAPHLPDARRLVRRAAFLPSLWRYAHSRKDEAMSNDVIFMGPHSGNMFFRSSVARKSANTRIRALSRLWAWRRTQSSAQCSSGTSNARTSVMSRSHK